MAGDGGHGASVAAWVATAVIAIGFTLGAIALIVWNWPFFWASVGVIVVGCVMAAASNIMDQVSEYGGHGPGGDPEQEMPTP